jgi:peptidoglycan/LPS O-acetylase OafA/YrhL
MSDESSRSARPSGQRRNDGAPAWWSALERGDLPEDPGVPAAHRRWYEGDVSAAPEHPEGAGAETPRRVRPAWIINTLIALAVALVLIVVLGIATSAADALTVSMLIGVPLILVVITILVVARRSR